MVDELAVSYLVAFVVHPHEMTPVITWYTIIGMEEVDDYSGSCRESPRLLMNVNIASEAASNVSVAGSTAESSYECTLWTEATGSARSLASALTFYDPSTW